MSPETKLLYHRLLGSILLAFGFLSLMLFLPYGIFVAAIVFFVLSHKQFSKVAELQQKAKVEETEEWLPPGVRRPPATSGEGGS